jgi:hypothetical protein
MSGDVRPYLVPDPAAVSLGPWHWLTDEGQQDLPTYLPDWDDNTDLRVSRESSLDLARLSAETGLPSGTTFAFTVSWLSSTTSMSGSAPPAPVPPPGRMSLVATLPGKRVAGVVTLRTTLTLANLPATRPFGVAWLPGSVLFEDSHRICLESTDPPFPMVEIDFAGTRLDPDASWHLETTSELTAPFLGSFQLLLNNRDTELITAVSRGKKDRRQEALIDELEHGVAALLLELALHHRDELADRPDWLPGTVGDVLDRTLRARARSGALRASSGPEDLAEVRTLLAGATRAAGRGRRFR